MQPLPADLMAPGAQLTQVATGATWSEGPCWIPDAGVLRWSDIHGDRILQFTPSAGDPVRGQMSEYRTGVEFTNGRTWHPEGYVVQCSHGLRRVEADRGGTVEPLVDSWDGVRLNSPNDVVVDDDGSIWFTDPHYGLTSPGEGYPGEMEYGACYVFRFEPASGRLDPVVTDMEEPNGLAFSADGTTLYVTDSSAVRRPEGVGNRHVRAYRVERPGGADGAGGAGSAGSAVRCIDGRSLFEIPAGIPDGLRVDESGRIWCSAADGVHVYTPEGEHLGHLAVPEVVANLCFGGEDGRDLYISATTSIYHLPVTVRDATWRRISA